MASAVPRGPVSGDYYDFVTLNSERMMLAVGDISGKEFRRRS